jgi:uncharacterized protein
MTIIGIPILNDKYVSSMDMWPLEAKEFNRVHLFYTNLRDGRFTTTKCKTCGNVSYPPRVICPECYSEDLEYVDLPRKGKVLVFTEQLKGVPLGFEPAPLVHAWIDLGQGSPVKRLLTRIINCPAGKLKEGDEVQFIVFQVPSHPVESGRESKMVGRVFFAFEPVEK